MNVQPRTISATLGERDPLRLHPPLQRMKTFPSETATPERNKALLAQQLWVLDRSRSKPSSIKCLSGVLWVTDENSGDILLRQGQFHDTAKSRKLLVQALTDSALQLEY